MAARKTSYLKKSAGPFLDYVDRWYSELPVVSLKSLLKECPPDQTALVIVDVVNGFCKEGNLASPRVAKIVPAIVDLVRNAEEQGMDHYLLPQDHHPGNSLEFKIYPEHCVEGSIESKTVEELQKLPNAGKFKVIHKHTINPGMEKELQDWLEQHAKVRQFIIVGDCTDICVHQTAMHLKIRSVKLKAQTSVVVPANCVDTYDVPVDSSRREGPPPHPADVMHRLFLYQMHLNGIRVVAGIE